MKKFNVTGLCVPEKHYMVDIKNKVREIKKMVEEGLYFTINRPRQYGKSTTMLEITKNLQGEYIVIDTSFEGVGDAIFDSEEKFCSEIFQIFADSVEFKSPELAKLLLKHREDVESFQDFSRAITKMIKILDKEVVLIIDEVDKSSGNRIFMQFLGVLRNKYLSMNAGKDITFKSVILGGVHDIKNIKLQIRDDKDKTFNSPWNVAADFRVEMSFSAEEIETMLKDYVNETGSSMDIRLIAAEIRKFTNGYPYLVSRLCKNIDEYLDKNWTLQGLEQSVKMTLKEKSTLFDDVIKNIENNGEIKATVHEILIEGRKVNYNPDAYEKGLMYGIFAERNGKLVIHNKLFEERIYNYLIEQQNIRRIASRFTNIDENQFVEGKNLNMEKVLLKFQEFMYQEYREEDERFYETNGRLIFLAYLKPILNGGGFSFVEAQTRQNKRMDVVITYGSEKYVVELKIWNGDKYEEKGIKQLVEYLDIQNLHTGYMVIFNFNQNKQYTSGWIQVGEKSIFEVIV